MRPVNEKLAADLLEAGKQEFLNKGFQAASMRSIATAMGVTTGAIYRYFTDKEAMFDALVARPAQVLLDRYREVQQRFAEQTLGQQLNSLPEVSDEGYTWMLEHIYNNFDAFKLIVCCSVGTQYEHYQETLTEIEVNASRALIERMKEAGMAVLPMDDELIHIVSSTLFSGIFETIRHDTPREKAFVYMNSLREFYSAGWFKILGLSES